MCWFNVGNTQRLTESGLMEKPGIKPGFMEKPVIKPATPGASIFCGFPVYKPVPASWFKIRVLVLCQEHPKAH